MASGQHVCAHSGACHLVQGLDGIVSRDMSGAAVCMLMGVALGHQAVGAAVQVNMADKYGRTALMWASQVYMCLHAFRKCALWPHDQRAHMACPGVVALAACGGCQSMAAAAWHCAMQLPPHFAGAECCLPCSCARPWCVAYVPPPPFALVWAQGRGGAAACS